MKGLLVLGLFFALVFYLGAIEHIGDRVSRECDTRLAKRMFRLACLLCTVVGALIGGDVVHHLHQRR